MEGAARALALIAQRAALRTGDGPLRPFWAAAYATIARATTIYLRRGLPDAAVYVRGSFAAGDAVYGPADIDLVAVVPPEPRRAGRARARTHRRWRRLIGRLPWLEPIVQVRVYETDELAHAVGTTTLTEPDPLQRRLRRDRDAGNEPSPLYADEAALRRRPGLGPVAAGWRRLGGPDLRPAPASAPRHLAAWLELAWWWRLCYEACLEPGRLHVPYLCLKLITQPARLRLWLEHGELRSGHEEVLARALATMPDEEEALRGAMRLRRELPRSPRPPLAEAAAFLLRTSERVAELLLRDAAGFGTPVRLLGSGEAVPATSAARLSLAGMESAFGRARLLPLADWRARTSLPLWRGACVDPAPADQVLAVLAGDAGDPPTLSALARAGTPTLRPAICSNGILLLPSAGYFDWIHRGVQFPASDPVSFALLAGERSALFPDLPGWSASDCARRAVAAHRIWLHQQRSHECREGIELGLLLGAVRAALFEQSVERGRPWLALSLTEAATQLARERAGSAALLEEASGAQRAWCERGESPQPQTVLALRRLVERLPAYGHASDAPALGDTEQAMAAER